MELNSALGLIVECHLKVETIAKQLESSPMASLLLNSTHAMLYQYKHCKDWETALWAKKVFIKSRPLLSVSLNCWSILDGLGFGWSGGWVGQVGG